MKSSNRYAENDRLSCGEAHPEHDVYRPDGHPARTAESVPPGAAGTMAGIEQMKARIEADQHADTVAVPPPVGRFPVIYADPPWGWSQSTLKDRGSARTVEKEYGTMKAPRGHAAEEIEALPVGDWATDNAALFLWVTGPKLQHGLDVMKAWGFTYKTIAFCWVKQNKNTPSLFWGMGFFTRANVELCLVGTKGKGLQRKDAGVHQVVMEPVSKHSRKPDEVRKRIERLYDGPYLELFARKRPEGWSVWGDEVEEQAA